jgi:hypothetical protein
VARKTKRSETLSIRIDPALKELLTIASNYMDTSIASVVEEAVSVAMGQARVPVDDIGSASLIAAYQEAGSVPITAIYKYALHEIPLVMQLRLFYLMPKALSKRAQLICETIIAYGRFKGEDEIFSANETLKLTVPSIDLATVDREMKLVEGYADYKMHEMQRADGFCLNYEDYRSFKLKKIIDDAIDEFT